MAEGNVMTAASGDGQAAEAPAHIDVPVEAQGFAATVVAVLATALMALSPIATRNAPVPKGWWVEPKTWPLICLTVTLVAAGYQALRWWSGLRSSTDGHRYRERSVWAFGDLAPALEYSVYFAIYLFTVSYLGFALSSLVFLQFVIWRAGLRSWQWRLVAALFVVAFVLVFRVGIQLWFPFAPIYEYAPPWFAQNIAIYL